MIYVQPNYKISKNITTKTLINDYGFYKTAMGATLRFPVYKYKFKTLIYGEFIFDDEEQRIYIRASDNNGNFVNYNDTESYGKSNVVKIINEEVYKKIIELVEKGVIC